ncbi:MAG: hypothetical protein ACTSPE_12175 [Candidatus Thorarchaeota archaeon]
MRFFRKKLQYVKVKRPPGDGLCSDNQCPCDEVVIPRGEGYLYIPESFVEFRKRFQSELEYRAHMMRMGFAGVAIMGGGPILMCRQGAELRGLDLEVAAQDAKYWWETGLVPLRPTPLKK